MSHNIDGRRSRRQIERGLPHPFLQQNLPRTDMLRI